MKNPPLDTNNKPQEHIFTPTPGGTGSTCSCGKSFMTTQEQNQHIQWHLSLGIKEAVQPQELDWLDQAKKAMDWPSNGEPSLLEYLRHFRKGTIGELHIEAAIAQHIAEQVEAEAKHNYNLVNAAIQHIRDNPEAMWHEITLPLAKRLGELARLKEQA